eukprot:TRINITY_DN273_c4_g1_i1.p1 TRINITY_DN273_c4_g1~~TRINITY_DN273_c4_g1_i1.p1  ORF type:complete len:1095 (+),score=447.13 TRINITY_DN273_c4_g1_i1:130-3414(+)
MAGRESTRDSRDKDRQRARTSSKRQRSRSRERSDKSRHSKESSRRPTRDNRDRRDRHDDKHRESSRRDRDRDHRKEKESSSRRDREKEKSRDRDSKDRHKDRDGDRHRDRHKKERSTSSSHHSSSKKDTEKPKEEPRRDLSKVGGIDVQGEIDKRREKIKLWRAQQEAKKSEKLEEDTSSRKKWSLENESDDEGVEESKTNDNEDEQQNLDAEEEEIDPLDAFMSENIYSNEDVKKALPVQENEPQTISLDEIVGGGGFGFSDDEEDDVFAKKKNNDNKKIDIEEDMDIDEKSNDIDDDVNSNNNNKNENNKNNEENNKTDKEVEPEEDLDDDAYYEEFRKQMQQFNSDANVQENGNKDLGRIFDDEDDTLLADDAVPEKSNLEILLEKMKKKDIKPVDHNTIEYIPFKKNFYIESPALKNLPSEEVVQWRNDMQVKIRGKGCPRPVKTWEHCGLSDRVLNILYRQEYKAPFDIQKQTIPAIMSGRDVIGVAKTGSGKTLAFLLPMLRHVMDQPPLADGEGPIALIMAPARELAVQIYNECKRFMKAIDRRAVAVYGGSALSDQISALKRGADVVVATPGRFIEILTLNSCKLISLARVTYCVLDEADRMFDMGFEPQIARIMQNIRPERQTVMFSATFPKHVDNLARRILRRPIEVMVGGRSEVASEIKQFVEIRNAHEKWPRLLQILGKWYSKGKVLIFVDTQNRCDHLFQELLKAGYPSLSLHGGKDQYDRDQTIADFKNGLRNVMVATSLAGRGLDVKDLVLVVNFNCPNHKEDYVHRVGRTGRAGKKGTAYTFITKDEEEYAPDLVSALSSSKQDVPEDLQRMCDMFSVKVKAGVAKKHISGYATKGYHFDDEEESEKLLEKEMQKCEREVSLGLKDISELMELKEHLNKMKEERDKKKADKNEETEEAKRKKKEEAERKKAEEEAAAISEVNDNTFEAIKEAIKKKAMEQQKEEEEEESVDVKAAKAKAAALAVQQNLGIGMVKPGDRSHFECDLEINDYPQQARWKATQKDTLNNVTEWTGCAITSRGSYVAPGRRAMPGERKLYLLIEGPTEVSVTKAKKELFRVLEEATAEISYDKQLYQAQIMM